MRQIFSLIAASLVSTITVAGANANEPVKLKFAVFSPPGEVAYTELTERFAKLANESSGGTLQIEMYPSGTLGRNPLAQYKMVTDGIADIAWVIPNFTPDRFPDIEVVQLPGEVRNGKEGSYAIWRLFERGMLRGFDDVEVISLVQAEPNYINANEPIAKLSDIAGLKLAATGRVVSQAIAVLKGVPVQMPLTKAPEAISRGVMHGIALQPVATDQFGIAKLAKHHYLLPMGSATLSILMNKKAYEKLPAKAKAAVDKHRGMPLSLSYGVAQYKVGNEILEHWRKEAGQTVVEPSDADRATFESLIKPIVEEWTREHHQGKALLDALRTEIADFRKR